MSVLSQALLMSYGVSSLPPPSVLDSASTGFNGTTNHVLNMPAGIQAGDFLLACIVMDGSPTLTLPSGWALVQTVNNPVTTTTGYIYSRVAAGSDTLTVTSDVSEASASTVYRISGASNCEATAFYNSSSVVDYVFPSITPSAGLREYLIVPVLAMSTIASTANNPAGFSDLTTIIGGATGSNNSARIYTWRGFVTASTITPGTVSGSDARQIAAMTAAIW